MTTTSPALIAVQQAADAYHKAQVVEISDASLEAAASLMYEEEQRAAERASAHEIATTVTADPLELKIRIPYLSQSSVNSVSSLASFSVPSRQVRISAESVSVVRAKINSLGDVSIRADDLQRPERFSLAKSLERLTAGNASLKVISTWLCASAVCATIALLIKWGSGQVDNEDPTSTKFFLTGCSIIFGCVGFSLSALHIPRILERWKRERPDWIAHTPTPEQHQALLQGIAEALSARASVVSNQ